MEFYEALKREILKRHDARLLECRDTDKADKALRAQGAARELNELVCFMELMENPPKPEEENS